MLKKTFNFHSIIELDRFSKQKRNILESALLAIVCACLTGICIQQKVQVDKSYNECKRQVKVKSHPAQTAPIFQSTAHSLNTAKLNSNSYV